MESVTSLERRAEWTERRETLLLDHDAAKANHKNIVGRVKSLEQRRDRMKANIEKQVGERKGSEDGLDKKLNKILESHGVKRAAYHGGDLNGVSGLVVMKRRK